MDNWKENRIDLGVVKENSVNKFEFHSLKILNIFLVKAGCGGCTSIGDYKNDTLPITFKPGTIPKHLVLKGNRSQYITKTIKVTYVNGQEEILTFTATILK